MNDAIVTVRKYRYIKNPKEKWKSFERLPFEFELTTRMMSRYFKPGGSIMEVGGDPGRYSLYFIGRGCDVTLVGLSEGNAAYAVKQAAKRKLPINAYTRNCLGLDALSVDRFDRVLLPGTLFHLQNPEDRARAARLALDRLKSGGYFDCSFILEFADILYDLKYGFGFFPKEMSDPETARLINAPRDGKNYDGPALTTAFFIVKTKSNRFFSGFPVEKIAFHRSGEESRAE